MYDTDGDGQVDSFEIGFMLSDCYRAMNKGFNPTPTDIASFTRVLDSINIYKYYIYINNYIYIYINLLIEKGTGRV